MTAPNFAEMTDAQLNECAALAMEWPVINTAEAFFFQSPGAIINGVPFSFAYGPEPVEWSAATDHDHAAEFSAWFDHQERGAGRWWAIERIAIPNKTEPIAYLFGFHRDGLDFCCRNASRPRAETIATLMAFDAMTAK